MTTNIAAQAATGLASGVASSLISSHDQHVNRAHGREQFFAGRDQFLASQTAEQRSNAFARHRFQQEQSHIQSQDDQMRNRRFLDQASAVRSEPVEILQRKLLALQIEQQNASNQQTPAQDSFIAVLRKERAHLHEQQFVHRSQLNHEITQARRDYFQSHGIAKRLESRVRKLPGMEDFTNEDLSPELFK